MKVFPDLYNLNQENGFLFVGLVTMWLRYWGIDKEVFYKEDWGKEFGGDNPHKLRLINEKWYKIYGAILGRAPKGRKGAQGRVERSHKTDDEEFYIPLIPTFKNCFHSLKEAQKWQIYYNTKRPHFGYGMNNLTPLEKLKSLGLTHLNENFANFPVIILDYYSPDYCHLMAGNDVLTNYINVLNSY